MNNLLLFLAAALIWGSTWHVITYQLGSVSPAVSVAYRFALAAVILFAWCWASGRSVQLNRRQHIAVALQGFFLFGLNYVLVYFSELYLPSGLIAVLFSMMVFCNIAGMRIFFGTPVTRKVMLGAILGVSGVALLLWPEIQRNNQQWNLALGLLFGIPSVLSASAGNLIAVRNQNDAIDVFASTAWGMLYGALAVTGYVILSGTEWKIDTGFAYLASLLYLALFGSIAAFLAYLTLLGKIGAGRAGYVAVIIPVVALVFSTFFEDYVWSVSALFGLSLCLAGNVLVLLPSREVA